MRVKGLGEFLKGVYEIGPQTIEPSLAIGPKLEGNTLYIKASFLEWTTILWLN